MSKRTTIEDRPMTVHITEPMAGILDDLRETGLYGCDTEEVARRLLEEKMRSPEIQSLIR